MIIKMPWLFQAGAFLVLGQMRGAVLGTLLSNEHELHSHSLALRPALIFGNADLVGGAGIY